MPRAELSAVHNLVAARGAWRRRAGASRPGASLPFVIPRIALHNFAAKNVSGSPSPRPRFGLDLVTTAHISGTGTRTFARGMFGLAFATVDGQPVTALFSGDTVIEPEFWGENAWLRVWAAHAFAQADRLAPEPLHWLLLTATHRSYRLLTGLFQESYPRYDRPTPAQAQARLDALVRAKFPQEYAAALGVVTLVEQTPVRPERLDPATEERDAPEVRFFKTANPGYARGDFLACITELSRDNITPLGRRVLSGR